DLSDQPLRPVRPASGLAVSAGPTLSHPWVCDSWTIPAGATPALCRLVIRILDDTFDDAGASALLGRHHRLHLGGDPVRGTRPSPGARGGRRNVPPICAYDRPLPRQERLRPGVRNRQARGERGLLGERG